MKYKFFSYQIQVSDIVKVTNRETYSLLEFCGDIGGLFEFLFVFVGMFISGFGRINLKALIANRLYSWENFDVRESIPIMRCLEINFGV